MSKIYVGTYALYSEGSIHGKWFDLEDYADKDDFIEACQAFHGPGEHEFHFQDWEGIPEGMVGESFVKDELWDWMELSDSDKELLKVYLEHVDQDGTLEQAREAFRGKCESPADCMQEEWEGSGGLEDVPESLRGYIDWDSVARDSGLVFVELGYHDVWAFYNN